MEGQSWKVGAGRLKPEEWRKSREVEVEGGVGVNTTISAVSRCRRLVVPVGLGRVVVQGHPPCRFRCFGEDEGGVERGSFLRTRRVFQHPSFELPTLARITNIARIATVVRITLTAFRVALIAFLVTVFPRSRPPHSSNDTHHTHPIVSAVSAEVEGGAVKRTE